MNYLTMAAITAAIFILAMQDWKETDEKGRKFFGRLESGAMLPNDRVFLKLMALALGVAAGSHVLFGGSW